MAIGVLLLIVTLTLLFYVNYSKSRRLRSLAKKLPGPPALPFVGNGLDISKTVEGVLYYLIKSQKKYGSVTRHWLGIGSTKLYTLLSDPKDVEILLRHTKNIQKSDNYNFVKPWLGDGLISSTGAHWHTHRKAITPAFHFNVLERFVEVFKEKGKVLIKRLEERVNQEEFDIYPYINIYALDAIIETAMGVKYTPQDEGDTSYVKAIHRITEIVHHRSFSILHRFNLTFPFTKLGQQQKEVLATIHRYCEKVIQQRKEELEQNSVVTETTDDDINLLLVGQKTGSQFTDADIREEVDTFMFAGHDTTTSAMTFALYYLAHYPDVQQKVYEEIEELLGDSVKHLTVKDLQNFKYLDQVVKEVLRITPPVPFISRCLESDLKLNDYTLPAGSSAGVFIYMLHRDPHIYPNPEKFDPSRFNEENTQGRHPYAFVPFSAGPRNCIGQKYAQLEIKSTLIKVIRHFRVLPGKPIERLIAEIVLKSANGIKVRLEKRNKC